MDRHVLLGAALALIVVAGCGSGSAPATVTLAPTTPAATDQVPEPGEPAAGEAVCAAITSELVAAALGEPAGDPQFGETAGSDGVYCYLAAASGPTPYIEVQFELITQDAFNTLAETLGVTDPLAGVGQSAFSKAGAYTGADGASVVAWDDGQAAVVLFERSGADQADLIETAKQIAAAVLAAL